MTERDIDLLLKLLNLTTSTNDHEALSAIRKANAILKRHGLTWKNLGSGIQARPTVSEWVAQQQAWAEVMQQAQQHQYGVGWSAAQQQYNRRNR